MASINELHAAAHRAELMRQADVHRAHHRRDAALARPPRRLDPSLRAHQIKMALATGAALAIGVVMVVIGTATLASAAPVTGTVHVTEDYYATGKIVVGVTNLVGHDIVAGAVADYGTATTPTPTSTIETLHLTKGTIKVNAQGFFTSKITHEVYTASNCSDTGDYAAGKVVVLAGTGTYAGITGTLTYHGNFNAVLAKTKAGTCNKKVAVAVFENFIGIGKVTY